MVNALSRRALIGGAGAALLVSSTASAGSTAFHYDAVGRLIAALYPDGALAVYEYDNANNRTVQKNPYVGASANITTEGFDPDYYIRAYPDVAQAGIKPYDHFMNGGWTEGRNPSSFFNTAGYRAKYTSVTGNPLSHYNTSGWMLGNNPSVLFNTQAYLNEYPDIKNAGINPLVHYLRYGYGEGREPMGTGLW